MPDIAAESGIVSKNGAYYTFEDESSGQGRERARQALIDRADLKSKIEALVTGTTVKRAEVEAA